MEQLRLLRGANALWRWKPTGLVSLFTPAAITKDYSHGKLDYTRAKLRAQSGGSEEQTLRFAVYECLTKLDGEIGCAYCHCIWRCGGRKKKHTFARQRAARQAVVMW